LPTYNLAVEEWPITRQAYANIVRNLTKEILPLFEEKVNCLPNSRQFSSYRYIFECKVILSWAKDQIIVGVATASFLYLIGLGPIDSFQACLYFSLLPIRWCFVPLAKELHPFRNPVGEISSRFEVIPKVLISTIGPLLFAPVAFYSFAHFKNFLVSTNAESSFIAYLDISIVGGLFFGTLAFPMTRRKDISE
jgi:hypothetical protein